MILFLGVVLTSSSLYAQVEEAAPALLQAGETALVYYSPKNTIVLDFEYTTESHEAGIYQEYAEDLLGITDGVQENHTLYSLHGVSIGTHTEADLTRPHKVNCEAGRQMQLLKLNDKGLLVGYNLPVGQKQTSKRSRKDAVKSEISTGTNLPYTDEILEAKSIAAQAQAVAKQILRLRETRLYLLSGEVEHAPADGEAMKRVLEELSRQESMLVELFAGKKTTTTHHMRVEICPTPESGEIIQKHLFFSDENGFTDGENIDADTIAITVSLMRQTLAPPIEEVKKGKKDKNADVPQGSQIVYNLPGHGDVNVQYQGRILNHRLLPIAQLGVDVPLDRELFSGSELPVIVFSEKTGNIVSISK